MSKLVVMDILADFNYNFLEFTLPDRVLNYKS